VGVGVGVGVGTGVGVGLGVAGVVGVAEGVVDGVVAVLVEGADVHPATTTTRQQAMAARAGRGVGTWAA
jgi:hypothetical protein